MYSLRTSLIGERFLFDTFNLSDCSFFLYIDITTKCYFRNQIGDLPTRRINQLVMETSKRLGNILKSIPSINLKRSDDVSLSSKDKRYLQLVEKALSSFDTLEEWADYIAFLSRLHKSLQLSDEPKGRHKISWIPRSSLVAQKLSLCLSSRLPNGVHQKTLSLYESIFNALTQEAFNRDLSVWLPGLFPMLAYCSIQVKPQLIKIFKDLVLANIYPNNLKVISKPLILTFLPGLDDENAEVFGDVFELMDSFKTKLGDDSHFWQCMFLCIIRNPEKRLGAFYWCNKRLPVFTSIKHEGRSVISEEAQSCLKPEAGLLVRAFATSINSSATLNSANDIMVVRGFFDLLLSHLPLNSEVFEENISSKDKELLIMSCCKVTLKKDMSLNRRLWNLFLGPDSDPENSSHTSRLNYFDKYALDTVSGGLLKMACDESIAIKIESLKISLSIIMDKWEISSLVTPKLFSPFLRICFKTKGSKDLIIATQLFFEGIETSYIWNEIVNIILRDEDDDIELLEFLLKSFNFNEEETKTVHAPLTIICLLSKGLFDSNRLEILELLVNLVPQRAYSPLTSCDHEYVSEGVGNSVKSFYEKKLNNENVSAPFSTEQMSYLIISLLSESYTKHIRIVDKSYRLSSILCELLETIPNKENYVWEDMALVESIKSLPVSGNFTSPKEIQENSLIALGITRLFIFIAKSTTKLQNERLLKLILTNLWQSISTSYPAYFQAESVRAIYELEISCLNFFIEAGVLDLLLELPRGKKVRAFETLWTHSTSVNDGDSILVRPLQVLLDDLHVKDSQDYLCVAEFIGNVLKSGYSNRLLKLITSPLLDFEFMQQHRTELFVDDDLGQFSYFLGSILNVLKTNEKPLKENFNNELAVMDSSIKLNLIKSNNWNISTYKSLMFSVIDKFFQLRLSTNLLESGSDMDDYYDCVDSSLKLLTLLFTGSETNFVEKFHSLLNTCLYYVTLPIQDLPTLELIITKFLKCIFQFLEISEELKINLNLLHVEDESKDPILVSFLIQGIEKSQTSLLLESWLSLLTRSLYLFNESIFSVLLSLNDCIIKKIEIYFERITKRDKFSELVDVESSINTLISGLEDLLSISHSFLLNSNMKYNADKGNLKDDSGFFGSVIQGVFLIESPAIRTSEQNKLYSILLSFQDAVNISFKIWVWADLKPSGVNGSKITGEQSLIFLAHKLKFRARKMIESLMELEKQEVIETLVDIDSTSSTSIKLLNILDGGRSQVTVPHLLDSIVTRCYPLALDDSRKSSLNIPISSKSLSLFLIPYFESIDTDTVSDIWIVTIQFLKEVISHPSSFKDILPDCLKVIKILSLKLNQSKIRDLKKSKKELSDVFVKVLTLTVSNKNDNLESLDSEQEIEITSTDSPSVELSPVTQDEVLDALASVLVDWDSIIQDSDRVSTCLNIIISNLVTPQIKSKKIYDLPLKTVTIIDLIGKHHPNKTWKSLVYDSFMDNSFFEVNMAKLRLWNSIITTWISIDREKIGEMIVRITPSVLSAPSNIFAWNEGSEIEIKIQTIKRITYMILIQPKDYFLSNLDDIFNRIEYSLNISCPASYRSELATLLRALTLKFSELHLLPRWTMISHELFSIFDLTTSRRIKDSVPPDELKLLLNACKLLDQLLLLSYDDFNLNEWLFVSSSPETINGNSVDSIIAIIDRISNENDFTVLKDSPIKIEQPHRNLIPLLHGVKDINSITQLRLFFDYLSLINYERTFGLFEVDLNACEYDILNDLI
jgi:hypothetical protein